MINDHEYIVRQCDGGYACPFSGCNMIFKKRENMQTHVTEDHNSSAKIKVFDTPDFGEFDNISNNYRVKLTSLVMASKQVLDQHGVVYEGIVVEG